MTHMDANFNFISFNDINNVTIYDNILYSIQCESTFLFFGRSDGLHLNTICRIMLNRMCDYNTNFILIFDLLYMVSVRFWILMMKKMVEYIGFKKLTI